VNFYLAACCEDAWGCGGCPHPAAARNGVSISKEKILHISRDMEDDEDWLPDRGKYPNFSIELILGLNNAKNSNRFTVAYQ
jgi:hypothetical protein